MKKDTVAFEKLPQWAQDYFGALFYGPHHVPPVCPFGFGFAVTFMGTVSTYDGNFLTNAVLLSHFMAVRLEIQPAMQRLRLAIWQRKRSAPGLSLYERHPDISEALDSFYKNIAPQLGFDYPGDSLPLRSNP